ncbi:hypothetical protein BKA80DRAFT_78532 [Phyllosticta citrichinensis]
MVLQTEHMVEIQFWSPGGGDSGGARRSHPCSGPRARSSSLSAAEIRNINQPSTVNTLPHAAMSRSRPGPLLELVVGRLVSCRVVSCRVVSWQCRVVGGSVGCRARHGRRLIFSLSISLHPNIIIFFPAVRRSNLETSSHCRFRSACHLDSTPFHSSTWIACLNLKLHLMGTCTAPERVPQTKPNQTKIAAASGSYPPVLLSSLQVPFPFLSFSFGA